MSEVSVFATAGLPAVTDLAASLRGMAAGAGAHHVDQTDKRVIAHTKLIGTGETSSVSLAVSTLTKGETYVFLCTFAGHSPIMRGTLVLADVSH